MVILDSKEGTGKLECLEGGFGNERSEGEFV